MRLESSNTQVPPALELLPRCAAKDASALARPAATPEIKLGGAGATPPDIAAAAESAAVEPESSARAETGFAVAMPVLAARLAAAACTSALEPEGKTAGAPTLAVQEARPTPPNSSSTSETSISGAPALGSNTLAELVLPSPPLLCTGALSSAPGRRANGSLPRVLCSDAACASGNAAPGAGNGAERPSDVSSDASPLRKSAVRARENGG